MDTNTDIPAISKSPKLTEFANQLNNKPIITFKTEY